mmetsp:Transcript_28744/g.52374  ORF Transcript_28744/g.52374 Transcript_28744/m.52374 type:complete len:383 (-) Transcript_28744:195-1343(-)
MEGEPPGVDAAAAAPAAGGEDVPVGDPAVVQEVLEYLLSKKNLVKDQLLASSMNPQMFIPIGVLAGHEMMKSVGASEELIAAAADKSTKLSVDEDRTLVRPILKSKRNQIIIRDVPSDTTESDIRSIFAGAACGERIASVKEEVNNTWFVKFDLDSSGTQDVLLWLRNQDFKGKPVNAAIKSEHFLRSFFPASGGMPSDPMTFPSQSTPMPSSMQFGSMPDPIPAYDGFAPPGFGGDAGCGGAYALDMALEGAGMAGMPPLWMSLANSLQEPGFWQPWGKRLQPPPLVFSSPTTIVGQDPPLESSWAKDGKGKGKAKGKDKDKDKGSWKGGKDSGKGYAEPKGQAKGYWKGADAANSKKWPAPSAAAQSAWRPKATRAPPGL